MALLDALLGKKSDTVTDVSVEPTTTIETVVIQDPITKPFPANILRNDIAWETAITGETEAVIHSED
jgi:hypothetical protein